MATNSQDVELLVDNAVMMGREEAEARGIRIGVSWDPTTTLVRPPGDVAPGPQSTTGAASSSSTTGAASGEAASSTSVLATGGQPASIHSSSGSTSRPPNIWEKRRKKRVETARELVRQSLWSDDEDDGMEGDGEDDGMEEENEVRPGRRRGRNPFIDDECGVSKRGREDDE